MTQNPTTFALKGAVCFSTDSRHLTCLEDAGLSGWPERRCFPEASGAFFRNSGTQCQSMSDHPRND